MFQKQTLGKAKPNGPLHVVEFDTDYVLARVLDKPDMTLCGRAGSYQRAEPSEAAVCQNCQRVADKQNYQIP